MIWGKNMRTKKLVPNKLGIISVISISSMASMLPVISVNASTGLNVLDEIVVTARKREENVQEVPDAVTVFSGAKLESAGIKTVGDFMVLIPNLTFQDGANFRSGAVQMTMRGVGNGESGWAPVTYVVDGVAAGSIDAINSGTLQDIERIEVLRGPQSALYGAGAIAGAINVITRKPTNEMESKIKILHGKGNDTQVSGMVSGPVATDRLYFRVNGSHRNSDGLIKSASNGLDLDFEEHKKLSGRLIYTPSDSLEIDFRAEYLEEHNGSTYQEKIASTDIHLLDTFNSVTEPRRRAPGVDDRTLNKFSLKIDWDFSWGTLSSITGYSDLEQQIQVGICWDDPDDPAVDVDPITPGSQVGCTFGPVVGSQAVAGETVDNLFDALDNFETITQDFRITSPGEQSLRWLLGVQAMEREAFNGFDAGIIVAPNDTFVNIFPRWDARDDSWWGVYAQLSYDITEKLELTLAGRHDDNTYENTQYADRDQSLVIQNTTSDGTLVNTVQETKTAFQPKVQLSYQWSDDLMTYFTWAEGFRAGFFASGAFTAPEATTNYEIGVKGSWLNDRLVTNAAIFHIDYSNQQFTSLLAVPPFRQSVTIPETEIDGAEFESTLSVNEYLTMAVSIGYVDARLSTTGVQSPYTSRWTSTFQADYFYPLNDLWNLNIHGDYRYHSSLFLQRNEDPISMVPSKDFLNIRVSLTNANWVLGVFAKNVFDTREAIRTLAAVGPFGEIIRGQNKPRSYGVELQYTF